MGIQDQLILDQETATEMGIQNQLLLDQDLSDSDDEDTRDDFEDEEIDNVSYDDPDAHGQMDIESSVADENQDQDDADLIQRNLLQDQDISDDDDE